MRGFDQLFGFVQHRNGGGKAALIEQGTRLLPQLDGERQRDQLFGARIDIIVGGPAGMQIDLHVLPLHLRLARAQPPTAHRQGWPIVQRQLEHAEAPDLAPRRRLELNDHVDLFAQQHVGQRDAQPPSPNGYAPRPTPQDLDAGAGAKVSATSSATTSRCAPSARAKLLAAIVVSLT